MGYNMVRVPAPTEAQIQHILEAAKQATIQFNGVQEGDLCTLLHYADAWVAVNGIVWIKAHDESSFMWSGWLAIVADDQGTDTVDNVMACDSLEEVVEYVQEFI